MTANAILARARDATTPPEDGQFVRRTAQDIGVDQGVE